jgi:hypothetical protein
MTVLTPSLIAVVVATPVVSADPAAQPQAGVTCDTAEPNAPAFAKPREGTSEPDVLMCVKGDQGNRWQQADGLQRPVHNFYTYGLNLGEFWDGVGATTNDICAKGNCRWVISPCSGRTGPSPCTAGYLSPGNAPRQRET